MSKFKINPLFQAFKDKNLAAIKSLLLSENAEALVYNFVSENTALNYAAQYNYTEIVIELLDKFDIQQFDKNDAIETAASQGHTDIVRALLSKGANVNGNYSKNWLFSQAKPLTRAALNKHVNSVIELICSGSDIDLKSIGFHVINTQIELLLISGLIIDNLYWGHSIYDIQAIKNWGCNFNETENIINCEYEPYNDVTKSQLKDSINSVLPRLEFLIKTHGVPSHLLDPNHIPAPIRPAVTNMVNILKTSDQQMEEAIEVHLAIILNKFYPDQFPSELPYSQALKYQDRPSDNNVCTQLLASYKEMPYLKPSEFFKYMINPANQNTVMELFIPSYNEANLMLNALDKFKFTMSETYLFVKLKNAFNSPLIKDKHTSYICDILDQAVSSIHAQANTIKQLETSVEIIHTTVKVQQETIKSQQETIKSQQETIKNQQETIPSFQNRIAAARIQAKQPKIIDSFFIKKTTAGTKRKAESHIELIENQRDSQKAKYQERGI